ncbi:MAG: hypothetical protein U0Q16_20345 [Bryobacteraceae bacterium]
MDIKLGAEPKKVAAVAILLPIAAYLLYSNLTTDSMGPPGGRPKTESKAETAKAEPKRGVAAKMQQSLEIPREAAVAGGAPRPNITRDRRRTGASQEWIPKIGGRRPEEQIDLSTIDPTLRLDLLAKLQNVTIRGGTRSLFEVGTAPPVTLPPDKKIKPGSKPGDKKGGEEKAPEIAASKPTAPAPDLKPPPPPIPLKFYGFVQGKDGKRAFFLNGDDIFMASEGQTIQSRYKVIRIGLNSAVVEDTQHSNQQTIRLEEPPQGV